MQRLPISSSGKNKREALKKVRAGVPLPVCLAEPDVWFIDEAAAFNETKVNA